MSAPLIKLVMDIDSVDASMLRESSVRPLRRQHGDDHRERFQLPPSVVGMTNAAVRPEQFKATRTAGPAEVELESRAHKLRNSAY